MGLTGKGKHAFPYTTWGSTSNPEEAKKILQATVNRLILEGKTKNIRLAINQGTKETPESEWKESLFAGFEWEQELDDFGQIISHFYDWSDEGNSKYTHYAINPGCILPDDAFKYAPWRLSRH